MHKLRILALAALFAIMTFAKPNFSGDWKLNLAKSDFGPTPAPERLTRKVDHAEPNLKYISTQSGRQADITTEIKYTTDGKECVNETRVGPLKGTAQWEGDVLVIKYKTSSPQVGDIDGEDRWTLSSDGKTTTVKSIFRGGFGEAERTLVLEKE
jgi:hypothetical protein